MEIIRNSRDVTRSSQEGSEEDEEGGATTGLAMTREGDTGNQSSDREHTTVDRFQHPM